MKNKKYKLSATLHTDGGQAQAGGSASGGKNVDFFSRRSLFTLHSSLFTQRGAALVMVLMSLLFMGGIAAIFAYWLQMESRQVGKHSSITQQQLAMESVTQKEIWRVFHGNTGGGPYTWSTLPAGGNTTYYIDGVTVTVTMEKVGKP